MKRTIVIGASPNPERYAYKAVSRLHENGYEVIPFGIREGEIAGKQIVTKPKQFKDIHTVTLYLGAKRQADYYDYILSLKPRRIVMNPGTENEELKTIAEEKGIEVVTNCTLVMLSLGIF